MPGPNRALDPNADEWATERRRIWIAACWECAVGGMLIGALLVLLVQELLRP